MGSAVVIAPAAVQAGVVSHDGLVEVEGTSDTVPAKSCKASGESSAACPKKLPGSLLEGSEPGASPVSILSCGCRLQR